MKSILAWMIVAHSASMAFGQVNCIEVGSKKDKYIILPNSTLKAFTVTSVVLGADSRYFSLLPASYPVTLEPGERISIGL